MKEFPQLNQIRKRKKKKSEKTQQAILDRYTTGNVKMSRDRVTSRRKTIPKCSR